MALSGMGSELHGTSKAMNIGQNFSEMAALIGFVACVTSISHIYKERLDDSELKKCRVYRNEVDCTYRAYYYYFLFNAHCLIRSPIRVHEGE
jgi:hypothetical protein